MAQLEKSVLDGLAAPKISVTIKKKSGGDILSLDGSSLHYGSEHLLKLHLFDSSVSKLKKQNS